MSAIPQSSRNYDYDVIADFRAVFTENCALIQSVLIDLEHKSSNSEQFNELRKLICNLKSDLNALNMYEISELVVALENMLSRVQEENVRFDPRLSDIILLLSHKIKNSFECIFAKKEINFSKLKKITKAVDKVCKENFVENTNRVLNYLEPKYEVPDQSNVLLNADLEWFKCFATYLDERCSYTIGRTDRLLFMAQQMNNEAGTPIDPYQLMAAIYIHDTSMAFTKVDVNKSDTFSDADWAQLYQHPLLSAQLLKNLNTWQQAAEMVDQHHERFDGNGYPNGIEGNSICDGAKLLAITDTFEAMTHQRAHRQYKRPLLRVVAEINSNRTTQFDPSWVDIFNVYIRKHFQ